jgi:Uma2 family endonuclease
MHTMMSIATEEPILSDDIHAPVVLHIHPVVKLSDEKFFRLCQANRDLRIERNARGELIIMPPAGSESSGQNADITAQLSNWAKRDGTGKAFDSSGGFTLPNGAVHSPDAAWLPLSKWKKLTAKQRKKFAPVCPDFVLELRSPSDRLKTLQEKMEEYCENGAELGLLVDPEQKRVHVYRRGKKPKILKEPQAVDCGPVLPGFVLDLSEIW